MEGLVLVGLEGGRLAGRRVGMRVGARVGLRPRVGARVGCLVGRREGGLLGAAPVEGEGAGAVPLPVLLPNTQFEVQLPTVAVWKSPVSGMR